MASIPRRAYTAARPLAARLFAVPILGYALRIPVGILKLPRFNAHLRRLDTHLRSLDMHLRSLDTHLRSLDGGIAPLDARVTGLERAWRQHISAFLNAVGTVPALASELARLRQRLDNADASTRSIWDRIELVRREILFESAHGTGRRAQADAPTTIARVLAPGKVEAARASGTMRLNLGCGHIPLPDYVNVDVRDLPGVDVVAEVDNLPFDPGSVDEIFSAHLVEHFPQEAMRRRLLPYWHEMLRPGGVFRAITPDAAAMLAGAGAGTYDFDDFREVVFGSQDYDGDYHYNLFTPDSFHLLLEQAGFSDIVVPVVGRRNGKCFEFEISARRI